jgi:APA family basic amino acid/polyamine antiporter
MASALVIVGTFEQILTYMGFALGIFPLFVAAGVFKLRRAGTSRFRLPGYPVTPLLFMGFGIGILVLAFSERPLTSCIALGTTALGLPIYYLLRRREGDGR